MSVIHTVGATTRYLESGRIKVTMSGRTKIVGYDHGARSAHVQAVIDAWNSFEYGEDIDADSVRYVADSESGRGSVYVVEFVGKVRT